jgi:hypothetical protein
VDRSGYGLEPAGSYLYGNLFQTLHDAGAALGMASSATFLGHSPGAQSGAGIAAGFDLPWVLC